MPNFKKALLILFLPVFLCSFSYLQAQKITTFQTQTEYQFPNPPYSNYGGGRSVGIIQLPDKGFLCLGASSLLLYHNSPKHTSKNIPVVFRLDSLGRTLWIKRYFRYSSSISHVYGINSQDTFSVITHSTSDIIKISDNTFAIAGETSPNNSSDDSTFLMSIDINGNILWAKTYNVFINVTTLLQAPDGGFLIGGNAGNGYNGYGDHVVLMKTYSNGNLEWANTYRNLNYATNYMDGNPFVSKIINAIGGGYLLNGMEWDSVSGWLGNYIYRISSSGAFLWSKTYGFPNYNKGQPINDATSIPCSDMIETPWAIYISGAYQESPTLNILKLDTSGNLLWAKGYKRLMGNWCNILYDSIKKNILIASDYDSITGASTYQAGYNSYFARLDTSGIFKSIHLYPVNNSVGGIIIPDLTPTGWLLESYANLGNRKFIQIPNGFALMVTGSDAIYPYKSSNIIPDGLGYSVIKTDTGGKSNNCVPTSTYPVAQSVSFSPALEKDSMTPLSVNVSPFNIPTGLIKIQDSVLCRSFVAWFHWGDTCAYVATPFYDSTYLGATSWKWNFGDVSSGSANTASTKNPTHIYKTGGRYKVTLIGSNGSNKDTVSRFVNIISAPTIISKDTAICAGDSIGLTAATGIHYSWSNRLLLADSTKQSVWAYPYQDTVFITKVTNSYGCSIKDTFRVKLNSNCPGTNKLSGIINNYATVISIDTCVNALILDTASYFKARDKALLIQAKGATIDTTNTASFGSIKSIGNAGEYEYVTIDSVAGATVYLRYKLLNSYDIGGKVQLVTIPQYRNVVITDTLKAASWNGTKGGILIFNASGTVIQGAPISATGQGFQGGTIDSGGSTCHKSDYYYNSTSSFGANKGEGIAETLPAFFRGRGSYSNGGGGGNSYEAGGGGGANFGAGGKGGNEISVCSNPLANGGIGGFGLNSYTGKNHLFMGGGGGAGFYHYNSATPGANGGGIVIISAAKIASDGNSIIASGANQKLKSVLDASGGGGGAGSILLDIQNMAMKTYISANGGRGGNDSFPYCKGLGGGGGGGIIYVTSPSMSGSIALSTIGGLPGINLNKSAPCYKASYGADTGQTGASFTGISISNGNASFKRPYTTILAASIVDTAHVQLSFTKSANPNVTAYNIYREINNGVYTKIATISHPASSPIIYFDTINTSINNFSYHVFTVDTCGDVSNYSATHTTMHLHDTVKGCEQAIYLNWNSYTGWPIKKYEVYRSVNNGNETVMATLSGNVSRFKDSTVNYHNQYFYRVLAYDSTGPYTSWSEKAYGKTYFLDPAKIINATKTITSATNGIVVVRWQSIAGQMYMTGTQLYYSSNGRNYGLLATMPETQDSFVQTNINTKTADQFYYIKNIDSCGTASDSSVINKTMTLSVSVGQLLHKLNWTPYEGFKIKEYKIERFEKGQSVTIDSVPGTDTASQEFPAPCNYAIYYRVAAVGYNAGELSWSDTAGHRALDTTAPNAAKITSLTVIDANNVQLNFISSDSPDVYKYVVERGINGTWTGKDFISSLHHVTSSYIDTINTISNQLCYTIITFDSCLNAAESDTICSESLGGKALFCKAQVQLALPKIISPPTAPDSFVIYRSIDNVNYNKINELPITVYTDIDTNVTTGTVYYYKLETVYTKAGMTSYSDTFRITPKIIPDADTAQLVYATVLKSDEANGAINIRWKRAALNDTNARGYYVYSYNPSNGKYALLKDVTNLNDTSFTNININTLQDIYKYYIITYNVCDVGINSNIHKTVLLSVQNNNLQEQLNWNNYLGVPVKSYSVYKSEDGGAQFLLDSVGLDSLHSDSNVSCGHIFTYQIQAMLANGEISFSDSITVKSFDTLRPVTKPIALVTVVGTGLRDGSIKIDWNGATDKNLEGYNIYRSNDGFYWSLIIDHWPGTSFIDTDLNTYGQSYYYKIQPIDSCGNTGSFTIYHETINLEAMSGNGYNQLSWNSYEGWNVKKYLLYRDGKLIDTIDNNIFNFKDTSVICKTVYQYHIKAIDFDNDTILSSSNTDSAKALNHIPPQKVYIKTVTVYKPNKSATISWTASKSYDVKNYYIYRKSFENGNLKFVDSTTATIYIDSSQHLTEPDCYYVFARDHCGNQSDASNQGCIIILNAKSQLGYNQLVWNSYQDWTDGLQSYNVYKNEDSAGWQLIGTTSSVQVNQFSDKNLGDSTIDFCYQIQAVENPGQYNQLSRSTLECVHQDARVFIPNTFTPYNQDGLNDMFGPKGAYIKNYSMRIYNRWGEQVYNTPTGHEWNGTFQGRPVQQGIYIYLITVMDYNGKQSYFKGTITMFE